MRAIYSHSNDPYFNLATEEYLLKQSDEDFFFLYINDPSVIIGKHQNAMAEVDAAFLEENGILLARRISGGGAVYHDRGNINYSFITNEKPGDYIRFKTYTLPVIEALAAQGLKIVTGKRNELLLGDKKISGTASHVFKNRVIHHGTLLFDTKLDVLSKCLYVNNEHLNDKAVKSVRSEVMNLKPHLGSEISSDNFAHLIFDFISIEYYASKVFFLNDTDIRAVEQLVQEKFSQWDWNYAYSPKYSVSGEYEDIVLSTEVLKGKIASIAVEGGEAILHDKRFPNGNVLRDVISELIGVRHDRRIVAGKLVQLHADPKIIEGLF